MTTSARAAECFHKHLVATDCPQRDDAVAPIRIHGGEDAASVAGCSLGEGLLMPEICCFYGIHIYIYYNDHAPPHFHAIYGEAEAQIEIRTGRVIAGRLPSRAKRLVHEWLESHLDDVGTAWERAVQRTDPGKIEPLP